MHQDTFPTSLKPCYCRTAISIGNRLYLFVESVMNQQETMILESATPGFLKIQWRLQRLEGQSEAWQTAYPPRKATYSAVPSLQSSHWKHYNRKWKGYKCHNGRNGQDCTWYTSTTRYSHTEKLPNRGIGC